MKRVDLQRLALLAALLGGVFRGSSAAQAQAASPQPVLSAASELLEEAQVSYVYGGSKLGDAEACQTCNRCLDAKAPAPNQRFASCPRCRQCSLDCSHFTALVFKVGGVPYPYLDTAAMASLSAKRLRQGFSLVDLGTDLSQIAAGDLLVYHGHVVLVERVHEPVAGQPRFRGDVIHATGGRDVKGPGEGVQRERFVNLATFRGPLVRILRHVSFSADAAPLPPAKAVVAPRSTLQPPAAASGPRLRPVPKRRDDDG